MAGMDKFDYDLFVIGAGSGGVRVARMAAACGASVAIAEDRYLGGTCVNAGCIPKKLFFYASQFADDFEIAKGFGWDVGHPGFSWQTLIANKNDEIKRLNAVYQRILDEAGTLIIRGRASLAGAHSIVINGKTVTAERIIIATGGRPNIPDIPGREYIISSDEAFHLEALPERIILVGGGYIAVEFAGIFHGLGVETSLLYRGELFLRGFDRDLREFLAGEMRKKGIDIRFNADIGRIERGNGILIAALEDGEKMEAGQIMYATGRKPNTGDQGLEDIGVEMDAKGAVKVNQDYQTSIPSVYAIGDVTDRVNLTPVALAEGMSLAKTLFGNERNAVDYSDIPTCVFSQPNLATVGLTEEQARARYEGVDVYKSVFTPMRVSLSDSDEKAFVKLVVDRESDRVVGAHMAGPDAGEIIQGVGIAIKAGATKAVFDATIGIHPTVAEEFVSMRERYGD